MVNDRHIGRRAEGMTADCLQGWQVLVTRPAALADALCSTLLAAGAAVHRAPMMTIQPIPATAGSRTQAQQLDQYDVVIVTSVHAAQYGLPLLERYWPQWPVGLTWLAIGAATAAALAAHNIAAVVPTEASSEGLLALPVLAGAKGLRILLLTGVGGRSLIGQTLAARGAEVVRLESYRRVAPAVGAADASADSTDVATALKAYRDASTASGKRAALVTSLEGLHNLLAHAPWLVADKGLLVVASARIAKTACQLGMQDVVDAGGADDGHLLHALLARAEANTLRRFD